MISPDVALVQLINRTAQAYVTNAPAFITYRERTRVTAPSLGRAQEIDRFVQVRQADNFAVMQDLPQGAQRTGQAFPIIPYFDPFTQYTFSWFANLKNIDLKLDRCAAGIWPMPPPDPSVDVTVPYLSFWNPSYAPDSLETRLHIFNSATPRYSGEYPAEVREDPRARLPARIELRSTEGDEIFALDYQLVAGHWVVTHGTFTSRQHVGPLSFTVIGETTYDQFTFPAAAPDPRLAGPAAPSTLQCG